MLEESRRKVIYDEEYVELNVREFFYMIDACKKIVRKVVLIESGNMISVFPRS